MKMFILIMGLLVVAIILNIFNYSSFLFMISITWYAASILIIYSGFKYSFKYKFIQFKIKEFISAIKSKSKNNVVLWLV